jgi:UDP-N-acetylmuramate--alanine ligase
MAHESFPRMHPLLKQSPSEIGIIHFTGIGGVGMSGIAQLLHQQGYHVQGSDQSDSFFVQSLRNLGIPVSIGHSPEYIQGVRVLVISSAVGFDNIEVQTARSMGIPVLKRAQFLGELMRSRVGIAVAGTHGKTTTTSLIAALLDQASLDPTVVTGGVMNQYSNTMRIGRGDLMVVEADESDGSLLHLPAQIGIVTNIDPDHMEFYKTNEALQDVFLRFLNQIPFYGLGIVCVDCPWVRALCTEIHSTPLIRYGFHEDAQIRALNVRMSARGMAFDARFPDGSLWENLTLALYGNHNVQNALAVLALAYHLKLGRDIVEAVFSSFAGVKRRFTQTGVVDGVRVIDDYAHHPVEIQAVLKAAKGLCEGRVIVVCQPHRYSRVSDLFDAFKTCFHGADELVLLPIYAAGETPLSVSSEKLQKEVVGVLGGVVHLSNFEEVAPYLRARLKPLDMLLCLGAGNITQLAYRLPQELSSALSI